MPRPRPLRRGEAQRALAHRLSGRVDRIRQLSTRFGLRSRRVFLVWTKFTGEVRGEGREPEFMRVELVPTPKVSDLTAVSLSPYSMGLLPVGSIRVSEISAQLTEEMLRGKVVPGHEGRQIPEPYDFFYEVVEDDRESGEPMRQKYRLYNQPNRDEGNVSWTVVLERISEDRDPDGTSNHLEDD